MLREYYKRRHYQFRGKNRPGLNITRGSANRPPSRHKSKARLRGRQWAPITKCCAPPVSMVRDSGVSRNYGDRC